MAQKEYLTEKECGEQISTQGIPASARRFVVFCAFGYSVPGRLADDSGTGSRNTDSGNNTGDRWRGGDVGL